MKQAELNLFTTEQTESNAESKYPSVLLNECENLAYINTRIYHLDNDCLENKNIWTIGAVTKVEYYPQFSQDLNKLIPELIRFSKETKWLAWIAPHYLPYALELSSSGIDISKFLLVHPRTLEDSITAIENALSAGTCRVVLGWLEGVSQPSLRRLRLAAKKGKSCGILFIPS